jgi:phosphoglycolate phosphatase
LFAELIMIAPHPPEDRVKALVFDFDGTLIKSKHIKRSAWSKVFGQDLALTKALGVVLAASGESSRYLIIRETLETVHGVILPGDPLEAKIDEYARRYGALVFEATRRCEELPGASNLLSRLAGIVSVYCSSNTPERELRELIEQRCWTPHFVGIYGYPRRKQETLARLIEDEGFASDEVLVVGDGWSDREAANFVGARFHQIVEDSDLALVYQYVGGH